MQKPFWSRNENLSGEYPSNSRHGEGPARVIIVHERSKMVPIKYSTLPRASVVSKDTWYISFWELHQMFPEKKELVLEMLFLLCKQAGNKE